MALKAILVDDEENNLENLRFLLENDCRDIQVAAMFQQAAEARLWLQQNNADVVFLDISMPGETGFEMLTRIPHHNFRVVFVTAHNEFAIQAIKASAVDYLLKPVNIAELQQTVLKLHDTTTSQYLRERENQLVQHLLNHLIPGKKPDKIALPQLGGVQFLQVDEIISLQADSNYTIIHKTDMHKLVVTKTLREFEELLDQSQFIRIHKSHIVNLKYVAEYSSSDGGMVRMCDGNTWSISRRQLDHFLVQMKANHALFFQAPKNS